MRKPYPGTGFIPIDRPPGAVDIEDVAQADYALEQTQVYGKLEPLIERLRSASSLFPEERALAANIIAKIWKRPTHRIAQDPRVLPNREKYLALCFLKLRVDNVPHERAVHQVAEDLSVSDSQVRKAIRNNEEMFGSYLRRRRSGK